MAAENKEITGLEKFKQSSKVVSSLLGSVDAITAKREAVLQRWTDFKEVAAARRGRLEDARRLQAFIRNADELEAWIANKIQVATDESYKDPTNLQGKIKKHQAFEAEIAANQDAVTALHTSGQALVAEGHYAADVISAKLESIQAHWELLKEKSTDKALKLQEAQELLNFRREADEVDSWISGKVGIANSEDVGKDLEHVEVLQKKFDDFINDLTANESRLDAVNEEAIKLIGKGHPELDAIKTRQQELNDAWSTLKRLAQARKEKLLNAREIHAFHRDADEITGRINEKNVVLSSEDFGKDLASVEALKRQHEGFARDLAALGDGVEALSGEATRLAGSFPESASQIKNRQADISKKWSALTTKAAERKKKLDDSYDLQRFLNDARNSMSWISDMKSLIQADELAKDVAGADALLQRHLEHKGEIDARQDSFKAVKDFGNALILKSHYASSELRDRLGALASEVDSLHALWEARRKEFEDCHDLQLFLRDAEQVDAWIAAQEASLANEDLGDSLDSVEALVKKHDDFEKSLAAHEEKNTALADFASRLIAAQHHGAASIKSRRDAVAARRAALLKLSADRRVKLDDSRRLQEFKRDADEAEAWINEKLQTATDESYRDPTNLRGKLKNHDAFSAELAANEGRITAVNDAGSALVNRSHYAAPEVKARLQSLNSQWQNLCSQSRDKGQKLKEANAQQDFNRRVEDIEAWCAEVEQGLSSQDLGKDLTSAQNLLKKHQLLEAEIASHKDRIDAITQQAKDMIDAGNFQADAIREKQQAIAVRYASFAKPAAERRSKLEDSLKLQQFFRDVDDEESWIKEKDPVASSANYGNSLTSVQNLQKKHNALQAELAGRQKAIKAVEATAATLVAAGHYAADSIRQRAEALGAQWRRLNEQASHRKAMLDDSLQAQQYYTDANEAEAWMTEKEPIVANEDYGKDEDSALALLKKHEAVEADLKTYDATVRALGEEAKVCKDMVPSESPVTSPSKIKVAKVQALFKYEARRDKELSLTKGEILTLVSKDTADWWRVQRDAAVGFVPASYVKEMEQQQQQQQQQGSPSGSPSKAENSSGKESSSSSIPARQEGIEAQYTRLLELAAVRRKRLEESQKLHQLNREVDEVESWMNDREAVASLEDVGNDLEHNQVIQKKFDDFLKDLAANETRVQVANDLANKFIEQGHSDTDVIRERQQALNARWSKLQELAKQRGAKLASAHEIHKFNRDADETKTRFTEKDVVLSSDDYGKDVASVEALQRKHEGAMRDLVALETKVKELQGASSRLSQQFPEHTQAIRSKQAEIDESWRQLQAKAADRKRKLDASLSLQHFLSDFRDLSSWISGMQALAASDELAKDASGAEALLKRHHELQTEVDARADNIASFDRKGTQLLAEKHYASDEIGEKLGGVKAQLELLKSTMAKRQEQLSQCHQLQVYNRLAEQAEAWISTREAPLLSEDVGSTLDGVEAMQKKHVDFEKSLAAQREKMAEVNREADRLVVSRHYDAEAIRARKDALAARWANLQTLSDARKSKLADALLVQQFHRDADEAEAWMNEKLQAASDPSYKDPTNLQGKIQKHQAFEAEVTANEGRISGVIDSGRQLIQQRRGESPVIGERISTLEEQWRQLCAQSSDKGQKLREAHNQQQFNHGVEDVEFWLSEVEAQLASKDFGKDLPSVQNLLKKHQLVEADISAHRDRIDAVNTQADRFVSEGHFDADNIRAKQRSINARYVALQTAAAERRTKLLASQKLQQLFRDMDDEESWIKEKERIASSSDYGKDLTGVQNLQKKHQAFDGELSGHEARVQAVVAAASELVLERHYAADEIGRRKDDLQVRWRNLLQLSEARRRKLDQSLQYQLFNADVDEEESWINEKQSMMSSEDNPDTLSGAQALVKKHEGFEADLAEHKERVERVCRQGRDLISQGHYQGEGITASMEKLRSMLDALASTASARKVSLNDRFKFLQFSREADSIEAWIEDKQPQAASQDYGKDLASVQGLIAKHDTFNASLSAFQPRMDAFTRSKSELVAQRNSNADAMVKREAAVSQLWAELLGTSRRRRDALADSQDMFQKVDDLFLEFAQKASQFNSWFENAVEDLTEPVRVNSLEEIKTLRDAHGEFMNSLSAAKERLNQLRSLDAQIKTYTPAKNPYTWFTEETLQDSWQNLTEVIKERNNDLDVELRRQEENEKLRKQFAKHANDFSAWLAQTRAALVEGTGTLEDQLEATKQKYSEVLQKKSVLKDIEELGAKMEDALILDNKYTEHSTVGLAQQWDQLEQLGMRMQHNLEQQIQAKNTTGVSEDQLKEFNETFRYFDKDRTGKLDHQELKSCLRSLGYSLAVVEDGQKDPEFEAILAQVDPNNDGFVTLSEFMSFMISRETENVESATEVVNAFKAAAGDKPYVTPADLQKVLSPEQADYCIRHMKPFIDSHGVEVRGGLDYKAFTQSLFAS